jgi:hypothetical protein
VASLKKYEQKIWSQILPCLREYCRTFLLAELKEVEVALTHARQEESQLPNAIKALQQERDIQARKALATKKKLKPVEGAADEDIKEIKEANQIRLRAISAIQSLLNL